MRYLRVPTSARAGTTPRQRIEAECERRGRDAFVAGCVDLVAGREADADLILALGGGPARWATEGGESGPDYWLRVWAIRGLLWVWDDSALPSILSGLGDDSWRVREMATKVVARHQLDEALPLLAELHDDENARVRTAAERAVARVG